MKLTTKQQNEIECLDYFRPDSKCFEVDKKHPEFCDYNVSRRKAWKKECDGRTPPSREYLSKKYNIEKEYFVFSGVIGGSYKDTLIYDWKKDEIVICYDLEENKNGMTGEESYFEASDKGRLRIKTNDITRFLQLVDAKRWRLRHMDMYEQGIKDVSYFILLGLEPDLKKVKVHGKFEWKEIKPKPVPWCVMEFIAKTIFCGVDRDIIRNLYHKEIVEISNKWN